MMKYAKEEGEASGGAGRPDGKTRKAENPRPPARGPQREKSADRGLRFMPKAGILPKTRAREEAYGLTVGLPRCQRCLSALTPEQLHDREPASRGAHHTSRHEDTQKAPRASEAGSKTFGSHLIQRTLPFAVARAHTSSDA